MWFKGSNPFPPVEVVMYVMVPDGRFKICGRGQVFSFNTEEQSLAKDLEVGDTIIVDEKKWEITGIERYWKAMYPPIPGVNLGVVVKEQ